MKENQKFARAAHMAARYGIHRCTWWRWEKNNEVPTPAIKTPSGDKLWDIEECDDFMRSKTPQ